MKIVPKEVELSSLPRMIDDRKMVVISLSSENKLLVENYFQKFVDFLEQTSIEYILEDISK